MAQDSEASAQAGPHLNLTEAVRTARRGFRRDTEPLVAGLDEGALYLPLAAPARGAPFEPGHAPDELGLSPHLARAEDGTALCVLFSEATWLTRFAAEVDWCKDDDELHYCTLPARAALDVAAELLRAGDCEALVINPSDEQELILRGHEIDALRQGRAVPLVGYVHELPPEEDEPTLVSELEAGAHAELREAIEACLGALDVVRGYRLEQTFNRERDWEPHPTLTLQVGALTTASEAQLQTALGEALEGKVPLPGYVDVVLERVGTEA